MYELKCRVEWGYWHGYFGEEYCVEMDFSGHIEIEKGKRRQLDV